MQIATQALRISVDKSLETLGNRQHPRVTHATKPKPIRPGNTLQSARIPTTPMEIPQRLLY